jgi:hypothetical protein
MVCSAVEAARPGNPSEAERTSGTTVPLLTVLCSVAVNVRVMVCGVGFTAACSVRVP